MMPAQHVLPVASHCTTMMPHITHHACHALAAAALHPRAAVYRTCLLRRLLPPLLQIPRPTHAAQCPGCLCQQLRVLWLAWLACLPVPSLRAAVGACSPQVSADDPVALPGRMPHRARPLGGQPPRHCCAAGALLIDDGHDGLLLRGRGNAARRCCCCCWPGTCGACKGYERACARCICTCRCTLLPARSTSRCTTRSKWQA
jgi:hypothetical protein